MRAYKDFLLMKEINSRFETNVLITFCYECKADIFVGERCHSLDE